MNFIVCKVHVYANFLKKKNRHKNLVDINHIEVYLKSFAFLEVLQTIFLLNKSSDFELSPYSSLPQWASVKVK